MTAEMSSAVETSSSSHFLVAIAFFKQARLAYRDGEEERASLYHQLGLSHGVLGELYLRLEDGHGQEEG